MFCNKCGNPLPEDSGFCQKCGAKVIAVGTTPQVTSPPIETIQSHAANSQPGKPTKKKKLPIIIAGVVGLFILIGIIGALTEDDAPSARQSASVSTPSSQPDIQGADSQLASREEAMTLLQSWLDDNPFNDPVTIQDGAPPEDETGFYFVLYQTEELAKIRAVKSNSRLLIVNEGTGNFTPIDNWYADRTKASTGNTASDSLFSRGEIPVNGVRNENKNFIVELKSYRLMQSRAWGDDYNLLVATFEWTNNSGRAIEFSSLSGFEHFAYQNGIALNSYDDWSVTEVETPPANSRDREIQSGTTQTVWVNFSLFDMTSPVSIELYESWTSTLLLSNTIDIANPPSSESAQPSQGAANSNPGGQSAALPDGWTTQSITSADFGATITIDLPPGWTLFEDSQPWGTSIVIDIGGGNSITIGDIFTGMGSTEALVASGLSSQEFIFDHMGAGYVIEFKESAIFTPVDSWLGIIVGGAAWYDTDMEILEAVARSFNWSH